MLAGDLFSVEMLGRKMYLMHGFNVWNNACLFLGFLFLQHIHMYYFVGFKVLTVVAMKSYCLMGYNAV